MHPVTAVMNFGLFGLLEVRDACDQQSALEFFNYGYPVPAACEDNMRSQALDWCRDYLSVDPVTTYLSTVTGETPYATVSETSTTSSTFVEEIIITVEVTLTATATSTTTRTSTSTSVSITGLSTLLNRRTLAARAPSPTCGAPRCLDPAVDCIDLTPPNLSRRPAVAMADACQCLNPAGTTVTIAVSTASAWTETTTTTSEVVEVVSETTSTTVSSTTQSTRLSTTTATDATVTTLVGGICDIPYNPYNPGGVPNSGNSVSQIATYTNQADCCNACVGRTNCVAMAWIAGPNICQHLIKTATFASWTVTNSKCPLGLEAYTAMTYNPTGVLRYGPCGISAIV